MIALITLVLPIGGDSGPFNLYSNTDGYVNPFETGVSTAALVAGYTSILVPNGTTTIRVKSTGICTNYIDIEINLIPTTTTTSSSSTTSTSTTAAPTTTSTSSSSTSTSTSTTTSTSSTTTTTTTLGPDLCSDPITVFNGSTVASIDNIYSTGMTIGLLFPVPPTTVDYGTQDGTVNPINVDLSNVSVTDGCLSLYVGCSLVENINVTVDGTYSFAAIPISALNTISIVYNDGPC